MSQHPRSRSRAALVAAGLSVGLIVAGCGSSRHDIGSQPPAGHGGVAGHQAGTSAPSASDGTPGPNAHSSTGGPTGRHASPQPDRGLTPTKRPASGSQAAVVDELPGSGGTSCVVAGSRSQVRAGSLAIGSIAEARQQFHQQYATSQAPSVVLTVIPLHAKTMPGASITITQGGTTRSFTSRAVQSAGVWRYYAVTLLVPASGTWRLQVHAGTDTGCVDVDFAK